MKYLRKTKSLTLRLILECVIGEGGERERWKRKGGVHAVKKEDRHKEAQEERRGDMEALFEVVVTTSNTYLRLNIILQVGVEVC